MANRWLVLRNRGRRHELPDVDRLFQRWFSEPFFGRDRFFPERRGEDWLPALDIDESEGAIVVRAEIPGVDPEGIEVSIHDDVLVLSGDKKEENEERGDGFYHTERRFGSFRRSVVLPASVDPEKINAEYEHGVLVVRLEKAEEDAPKRIPVSVSTN